MIKPVVEAICPRCGVTVGVPLIPSDTWCWSCGRPFHAAPLWVTNKEEFHGLRSDFDDSRVHLVRPGRDWRTVFEIQFTRRRPRRLGARHFDWWRYKPELGAMIRSAWWVAVGASIVLGILVWCLILVTGK